MNQEKAKIIEQVEREEEFLTNSLQKKLIQLQREKIEIENQLEQEQENLVNRFVKQLEGMKVAANAGSGGTSCGTATLGIDTERLIQPTRPRYFVLLLNLIFVLFFFIFWILKIVIIEGERRGALFILIQARPLIYRLHQGAQVRLT